MLASLKVIGRPLLAAVLGFAGGYRVHAVPEELPRERFVVVTSPQSPAPPVAVPAPAETEEVSGARAAAMSSGVVLGGEIAQPLPAY